MEGSALPNEFVGAVESLKGLAHPTWGSVAVILRNGRPERLVLPGSRFGRGWRAPLVGDLAFAPVQTDSVPFGLRSPEVPTQDGYHISITLDARVRLNPAGDYRYLDAFVRGGGPNFADDLVMEVRQGLERLLFDSIGRASHAELRAKAPAAFLVAEGFPIALGSGLLLVTSLTVGAVEWDQRAIALEDVRKDHIVDVTRVHHESALGHERLDALGPLAQRLGLPAMAMAFPEQYQADLDRLDRDQQRAHETLLAMLTPEMRGAAARNPLLLETLAERAGLAIGHGSPPVVRAQQARPLGIAAGADDDLDDITAIIVEGDDVDLNLDRALQRLWQTAEDVPLLGIDSSGRGASTATVVAVTQTGARIHPETPATLAKAMGGVIPTVIVLAAGSLQELVEQWFEQALADGEGLRVVACPDGDVLTISVEGPLAKANAAVKQLNDPGEHALAAFEALLSFVRVDIRLAG